jgi:hypothetical protein
VQKALRGIVLSIGRHERGQELWGQPETEFLQHLFKRFADVPSNPGHTRDVSRNTL